MTRKLAGAVVLTAAQLRRARKASKRSAAFGQPNHPVTGEKAPKGQQWVRNAMNGEYVLEAIGTPFTSSVSSESYWAN